MSKFKYQPMDPDLKKYWVEKLRSGEYKQGRKVLRNIDDRFCCLGVLCDVMGPDRWYSIQHSDGKAVFHFDRFDKTFIADDLQIDDGDILDIRAQAVLIEMNDSDYSFAEIADWIEENL